MKHYSQRNWIISSIFLFCLAATNPAQAQVASDGTSSTTVNTTDKRNFTITNGTQAGSNLFHSFSEFSIPTGGSASFDHLGEIQNIISRVTGSSISNIDGLIQASGSANLFLLNPNGIIFGPNASLNIGGSFLASTASSLKFTDGNSFSATAPQATPLLLVNVPIGLQFGDANSIINQSQALNSSGESIGLQIQPGKTLALVGGAITLDGGYLTAEAGRIELGSVAGSADVNLLPTPQGLALNYEGVQNFQDIELSNLALVSTNGEGGGDIQVQGRNVKLSGGSQILANPSGAQSGGNLIVNASNSVEVLGTTSVPGLFDPDLQQQLKISVPLQSILSTTTFGTGSAGNLTINTGKLIIQDGAQVTAEAIGLGQGGNLTVNASDSVEVSGTTTLVDNDPKGFKLPGVDREFTVEINASSSLSNATVPLEPTSSGVTNISRVTGDLTINTGKLIVNHGGSVAATPFGTVSGGNLIINASDSVEVSDTSESGVVPSTVTTNTFGIGDAGDLVIDTKKLLTNDGGLVTASTFGAGKGGNLTINASDSVEVNGISLNDSFPSGLSTESRGTGNAGDLTIRTRNLSARNGAGVVVNGEETGKTGNIKVTADSIFLDTKGNLSATANSGEGGDITLKDLNFLTMRGNSEISTNAGGTGNGGNIDIDTQFLIAPPLENSDISANAGRGLGGRVEINSQGIFGIESRSESTLASDITATSQQGSQFNGVVDINTLDIDPSGGLVTLPVEVVDISRLIAQGCQVGSRQGLSKFVVTGRGGLPPNPRQTLNNDTVLADLGTPVQESKNQSSAVIPTTSPSPPAPVIEAQGWVLNSKGNVVLTAQAHNATPQSSGLPTPSCSV